MNSESKTRQIDSGVSSPLPQEESNYEPTKYLRSNLKNCDSDVPSFQSPEETKYKPKKQENSLEICVSSDSEDDSGIQVLNEFSKDKSVRTDATTVIDLADMSRDSECDSDIEHLPCFRNPMVSQIRNQHNLSLLFFFVKHLTGKFTCFLGIANSSAKKIALKLNYNPQPPSHKREVTVA